MTQKAENSNTPLQPSLDIAGVSSSTINIQNVFNHLSEIGWGENKIFNNTQDDIDFLYELIQCMSGTAIVLKRATYLENGGLKTIDDFFKEIVNDDDFTAFMLKNYNFIKGEFVFDKTIEKLEELSGVLCQYYC